MKNSNFQRLTVHLFNHEHKKDFQTTYTYYDIKSEHDAISAIQAMHSSASDTNQDLIKRVKKAVYNGKEINLYAHANSHTRNGWLVK